MRKENEFDKAILVLNKVFDTYDIPQKIFFELKQEETLDGMLAYLSLISNDIRLLEEDLLECKNKRETWQTKEYRERNK